MKPLLALNQLRLGYGQGHDFQEVVGPVSFDIMEGEAHGLIGESGSGKSTLGLEVLHLLTEKGGHRSEGGIITKLHVDQIAYIPQDPNASLDPLFPVGDFLKEMNRDPAAIQTALEQVHLSLEKISLKSYPHELSGGMKQRLVIAGALLRKPRLIVADEPTSSLDVTIQAQIMTLFAEIKKTGITFLFITHHLPLAAQFCDRITVLSKGRVVETSGTRELFQNAKSEYTRQLIQAVPRLKR